MPLYKRAIINDVTVFMFGVVCWLLWQMQTDYDSRARTHTHTETHTRCRPFHAIHPPRQVICLSVFRDGSRVTQVRPGNSFALPALIAAFRNNCVIVSKEMADLGEWIDWCSCFVVLCLATASHWLTLSYQLAINQYCHSLWTVCHMFLMDGVETSISRHSLCLLACYRL